MMFTIGKAAISHYFEGEHAQAMQGTASSYRVLLKIKVTGDKREIAFFNPKDTKPGAEPSPQTFNSQQGTVVIIPTADAKAAELLAGTLSPILGEKDQDGYYSISEETFQQYVVAGKEDIYNSNKAGFIESHQPAASNVFLKNSGLSFLKVNVPEGEEFCFIGDVKEVPEGKQYGTGSFFIAWDAWNGYRKLDLQYGLDTLRVNNQPIDSTVNSVDVDKVCAATSTMKPRF